MKKIFCIVFTFLLATALFACSKDSDSGLTDAATDISKTEQGDFKVLITGYGEVVERTK